MEKWNLIASLLFLLADICAVASLINGDWLVCGEACGDVQVGLLRTCTRIRGRNETECYASALKIEWLLAFVCVVVAIGALTIAVVSFALGACLSTSNAGTNHGRLFASSASFGKSVGMVAVVAMCVASVLFPAGFHIPEIGTVAYQLNANVRIGLCYILFVLGLWLAAISEFLANRVCLPRL